MSEFIVELLFDLRELRGGKGIEVNYEKDQLFDCRMLLRGDWVPGWPWGFVAAAIAVF